MSTIEGVSAGGRYGALLVAPHPDDAELGCGYLLGSGSTILVLTHAGTARAEEASRAAKVAGCAIAHLNLPDGLLDRYALDLCEVVESWVRTTGCAIVAGPPAEDEHQDHAAVARAVRAATRRTALTVLEYETPSTPPGWRPDTFPELSAVALARQVDAVAEHTSQLDHPYTRPDAIRARARRWGARIGHDYAEAYRTVRRSSI